MHNAPSLKRELLVLKQLGEFRRGIPSHEQ